MQSAYKMCVTDLFIHSFHKQRASSMPAPTLLSIQRGKRSSYCPQERHQETSFRAAGGASEGSLGGGVGVISSILTSIL